jgi:hypothetical protein
VNAIRTTTTRILPRWPSLVCVQCHYSRLDVGGIHTRGYCSRDSCDAGNPSLLQQLRNPRAHTGHLRKYLFHDAADSDAEWRPMLCQHLWLPLIMLNCISRVRCLNPTHGSRLPSTCLSTAVSLEYKIIKACRFRLYLPLYLPSIQSSSFNFTGYWIVRVPFVLMFNCLIIYKPSSFLASSVRLSWTLSFSFYSDD